MTTGATNKLQERLDALADATYAYEGGERECAAFKLGAKNALVHLDAAEAEIARLKNFLQFLKTPLQEIDGLFGDIRNDWTDPRHECRSGRESVAIVEAMIEELLRTKDAG